MALADSSGAIVERYEYTLYGERTVMNASYAVIHQSAYDIQVAYTGQRLDPETGLMYFRGRMYDPTLGRFPHRDPIGYPDGMNTYAAYHVMWGGVDPWGNSVLDNTPRMTPDIGDPNAPAVWTYPDGTRSQGTNTNASGDRLPNQYGPGFNDGYIPHHNPNASSCFDTGGNWVDVTVTPKSWEDTMSHSIQDFFNGLTNGGQHTRYIYPEGTELSSRFYNNHDFASVFKEWFENGSKTFCDCSNPDDDKVYWSGRQRVKFKATSDDFWKDMGNLASYNTSGDGEIYRNSPFSGKLKRYFDYDIHLLGSFTVEYESYIDCCRNIRWLKMCVINDWSAESLTRNPFTGKPMVKNNQHRKVRQHIEIQKEGKACE